MGYGNKDNDPNQNEGQLQGEAQLQGEGQGQGEAQAQAQSSLDTNLNANGNFDLNGNGNFNTNSNQNSDEVDVKVNATVSPVMGFEHMFDGFNNQDGSMLFMPQDITQTINDEGGNGTYSAGGAGTDTMIALDQVNSLVSNGSVRDASVSDDGGSGLLNGDHLSAGGGSANDSSAGGVGTSDTAAGTGSVSNDASSTSQLDAFTQSIVLGANIQYNNFTVSVVGHDAISAVDHH
jgi:hypothetical protein